MEERPDRLLVLCLLAALVILPVVAGCGGVWMDAEHSALLDKTTALSIETATRAKIGALTQDEMVDALARQSETWQMFRDARDGKADE